MQYMIDSDILIYWINGNYKIDEKFKEEAARGSKIVVSIITACELYFGAFNSVAKEKNNKLLDNLFKDIEIIQTNQEVAKNFGKLKAILKKKGKLINDADILIASIAMTNNCVLVTNNIKHFKQIEGLKIENWFL